MIRTSTLALDSVPSRIPHSPGPELRYLETQDRLATSRTRGRRSPKPHRIAQLGLCLCLFMAWPVEPIAGELKVVVKDTEGAPVSNAVVSANPVQSDVAASSPVARGEPRTATISQKNQLFVPFVTVVQTGTMISFPNEDDILHNVYSFSTAKKFKLPLYRDNPPSPIVFDKPGTVILGCNIHDWMAAYVYVVDTPYFAKSNENGTIRLSALPPGDYKLQVNHPRKRKRGSTSAQTVRITHGVGVEVLFTIALKPEWRPQKHAMQSD